jgi:hypothetical protein
MNPFSHESFLNFGAWLLVVGWFLNLFAVMWFRERTAERLGRFGVNKRLSLTCHLIGVVVYPFGAYLGFMWYFDVRRRDTDGRRRRTSGSSKTVARVGQPSM